MSIKQLVRQPTVFQASTVAYAREKPVKPPVEKRGLMYSVLLHVGFEPDVLSERTYALPVPGVVEVKRIEDPCVSVPVLPLSLTLLRSKNTGAFEQTRSAKPALLVPRTYSRSHEY